MTSSTRTWTRLKSHGQGMQRTSTNTANSREMVGKWDESNGS